MNEFHPRHPNVPHLVGTPLAERLSVMLAVTSPKPCWNDTGVALHLAGDALPGGTQLITWCS